MRRWLLRITLAILALFGVAFLAGLALPAAHTASRAMTVASPPEVVFSVVTDFARYPEWRTDVKTVTVEGQAGAGMIVREDGANGVIPFRVETYEPPARLVLRIADPSLPFGGTWTYQFLPAGAGTAVTLTEDGEVYNPIFRVIQKLFFSPYATIDVYLENLQQRLTIRRS